MPERHLLPCDGCEERATVVYLDESDSKRHWVATCAEHNVRNTNPSTLMLGVTTVMGAEVRG